MKLKNKVAIITGAARGIGLACAERFAAESAKVVITDVLDDVGSVEAKRLGATYLHCDVSKSGDVKAVVAAVVEQFGGVDILMNNAAISISGDFLEISEADTSDGRKTCWLHHQHVIGKRHTRHPINRKLLRRQGWHFTAYPRHVDLLGPLWHPCKRNRARLHHDGHVEVRR